MFKKIAIINWKGKFSKIKVTIWNIPIEAAIICNISPSPAVSNWLNVGKLKRNLKYRVHVYFQPIRTHITYQTFAYLKSHNKFYADISIANGFSSEEMFRFFDIVKVQGVKESITEKGIFDSTQISQSINDTKTRYASVESPLSMHRTLSDDTILISGIPNIIVNKEIVNRKICIRYRLSNFCQFCE